MENSLYYAQLISRYVNDELTAAEFEELSEWLAADDRNFLLFEELTRESSQTTAIGFMGEIDVDKAWEKVMQFKESIPEGRQVKIRQPHFSLRKIAFAAVAAAILFFVLLLLQDRFENKADDLISAIQPGGNKATLTMSDGKVVALDGLSGTLIENQGGVSVIASDGLLQYKADANEAELQYNIVQTPRGGKYQLVLADGTKVWLNASSRLRFPTVFSATERSVELDGEGYFDVKKNVRHPFSVKLKNGASIKVLGTTFNINAYSDETDVKTTLLEGKISFESDTSSRVLLPGQQLRFFQDQTAQSQTSTPSRIHSRTELYDDVDLEQAVAWTNDLFIFNSQHVTSIMRQISRWYDLDIKYDATFSSEKFSGIVSSKSNLSQVLKIMEEGGINFKLEGKTLTVF